MASVVARATARWRRRFFIVIALTPKCPACGHSVSKDRMGVHGSKSERNARFRQNASRAIAEHAQHPPERSCVRPYLCMRLGMLFSAYHVLMLGLPWSGWPAHNQSRIKDCPCFSNRLQR